MKWQVLLGMVISAGFLLLIATQVHLKPLVVSVQSAHFSLLMLAALAQLLTYIVRAWRWHYLLEPVKSISTLPLLSATAIGFMANMLLPARAGEVVRAYVISRKEQMSTMTALATIIVERVADLLAVLLILVLLLYVTNFQPTLASVTGSLKMGGLIALVLCMMLIGGIGLAVSGPTRMIRWGRGCLRIMPVRWQAKIFDACTTFVEGLQVVKKGRHLVAILILSLLLWTIAALSNVCVFYAFDLYLPVYAAFFILLAQIFGVMIPSSPGYIGTYHAAVVIGLGAFAVTDERALSVSGPEDHTV